MVDTHELTATITDGVGTYHADTYAVVLEPPAHPGLVEGYGLVPGGMVVTTAAVPLSFDAAGVAVVNLIASEDYLEGPGGEVATYRIDQPSSASSVLRFEMPASSTTLSQAISDTVARLAAVAEAAAAEVE